MPRGNKTGPEGMGPMTGRRMGYCAGNDNPGFFSNASFGFGLGQGNRGGRGQRNRQYSFARNQNIKGIQETENPDKKSLLENEIKIMRNQLSFLEKELSKLS